MRNLLLSRLSDAVGSSPDSIAWETSDGMSMSYRELWDMSSSLALRIRETVTDGAPVIVYGHKSPSMVASFVACMRSGHAYVPTDVGVPDERISDIISQLGSGHVIAVDEFPDTIDADVIHVEPFARTTQPCCDPSWSISGDDVQYIIFTSGSTGRPKGVMVTSDDVSSFVDWDVSTMQAGDGRQVFLNQALLSFDLSVTETVASLATGGKVFSLTSGCQQDMAACFDALGRSGITRWVSTPSFVTLCLVDPSFDHELMPDLSEFFFCGEQLMPWVVRRLHERFPGVRVVNAYGPTESTVYVSAAAIDDGMCDGDMLPVGFPRPGTRVFAVDDDGDAVGIDKDGELVICGDTVALGYVGRQSDSFCTSMVDGRRKRAYRTGDVGHVDGDGMLWCNGRIDSQVKMNGYRIELGEVEAALSEQPEVALACVTCRRRRVSSFLVAHVELAPGVSVSDVPAFSREMCDRLSRSLPAYMLPHHIIIEDSIRMTPNGKIDRKAYASE